MDYCIVSAEWLITHNLPLLIVTGINTQTANQINGYMDNLFIKGKDERPQVNFNAETGVLELSRSSYPEYTKDLYQPVMDWLDQFLGDGGKKIEFNFKMDYFNTSTSQRFQKIIKKLEDYHLKKDGEVTINWYYEKTDIDMFENGEDYSKDVQVTFNLIAYEMED